MSGWLWVPVGWMALAMVISPIGIGKPRKPLEAPVVSVVVVIQFVLIVCILKGGGLL